jgi:hypothetical protein
MSESSQLLTILVLPHYYMNRRACSHCISTRTDARHALIQTIQCRKRVVVHQHLDAKEERTNDID